MKNTIKIGFTAIVALSAIIYSCGKYEEGPKISLASKKGRLAGTWKLDKYLADGVDKTTEYRTAIASESFAVDKKGKYTYSQTSTSALGGQTSTDAGTWEFIEKKEALRTLSDTSGAIADTSNITRLTKKELWLKSASGTPVVEIRFIQ